MDADASELTSFNARQSIDSS